MIKFFRHIRKSLLVKNKTVCHSALDAESTFNLKPIPVGVYLELGEDAGMKVYYKL